MENSSSTGFVGILNLFRSYGTAMRSMVFRRREHLEIPISIKQRNNNLRDLKDLSVNSEANLKFLDLPLVVLVTACVMLVIFQFDVSSMDEYKKGVSFENIGQSLNGNLTKLLIFDLEKPYDFWRFITYTFVHYGLWHLLQNLFVLLIVGFPLERVQGHVRVAIIYVVGGINAAVGFSISKPKRYLIGASGSVFALILAYIATIILTWPQRTAPRLQITICVLFCIVSFGLSFSSTNDISDMSHIIGGVTGFVLCFVMDKNKRSIFLKPILKFWKHFVVFVIFVYAFCYIYFIFNVTDVTQSAILTGSTMVFENKSIESTNNSAN